MERVAYRHLLDRLTEWATHHPDVIGLVAVGSTASTERIPDEYSDHDLIVGTRPGSSDASACDLRRRHLIELAVLASALTTVVGGSRPPL